MLEMLVLAMHQCKKNDVQSEGDQPRLEEKMKKTKEKKKKEKEKGSGSGAVMG